MSHYIRVTYTGGETHLKPEGLKVHQWAKLIEDTGWLVGKSTRGKNFAIPKDRIIGLTLENS